MKLLKNADEVIAALSESKTQKQHSLTSTKYNDKVTFKCGCGKTHRVNDPNNKIISVAMPVKFCFLCENSYVVFVQVKGFFNTKATTIWSCKSKLFSDALIKLGLGDAMKKGFEKGLKKFEEYKKELKIINSYGAVLKKFAGYWVINEKHLSHKKKDIKEAIKLVLTKTILEKGNYDVLISGYMQLGLFQKYQDVPGEDILGTTPEEYLKKGMKNQKKHQKMMDKANKEQDELYGEITLLAKTIKEKVKSK